MAGKTPHQVIRAAARRTEDQREKATLSATADLVEVYMKVVQAFAIAAIAQANGDALGARNAIGVAKDTLRSPGMEALTEKFKQATSNWQEADE